MILLISLSLQAAPLHLSDMEKDVVGHVACLRDVVEKHGDGETLTITAEWLTQSIVDQAEDRGESLAKNLRVCEVFRSIMGKVTTPPPLTIEDQLAQLRNLEKNHPKAKQGAAFSQAISILRGFVRPMVYCDQKETKIMAALKFGGGIGIAKNHCTSSAGREWDEFKVKAYGVGLGAGGVVALPESQTRGYQCGSRLPQGGFGVGVGFFGEVGALLAGAAEAEITTLSPDVVFRKDSAVNVEGFFGAGGFAGGSLSASKVSNARTDDHYLLELVQMPSLSRSNDQHFVTDSIRSLSVGVVGNPALQSELHKTQPLPDLTLVHEGETYNLRSKDIAERACLDVADLQGVKGIEAYKEPVKRGKTAWGAF